MKEIFETKEVIFEIKTPIFIGSGDEYFSIDYVFKENKLKIINKDKFNNRVFKDKELYENLLNISDNVKDLNLFFEKHAKEFLYEVNVSNKAKEIVTKPSTKIKKFIRDNFTFTSIIPGSTIKGAIRTAIANYIFYHQKFNELKNERNENRFLNKIFRDGDSNAKEDILKALIVSDFKPIDDCKLKILKPFYKINIEDTPNDLDLLEFLISGKFKGKITINRKFAKWLNFELIKKALKDFYKDVLNFESNRINDEKYKFPNYEDYLIKIGLHSGAGSKTIKGKRNIKVKLKNEKLPKYLDYQLSTWFDENNNALGWGKLIFED